MAVSQRIYLDHNATSPLRPEAAEVVLRALQLPGNASSVHAEGRAARAEIEKRPREGGPSRRRPGEERRLHQRRDRGCESGPDAKLPPPRAAGDDPAPPGSGRASLRSQRPPVSRGCRRAHPGRFQRDPRSGLARGHTWRRPGTSAFWSPSSSPTTRRACSSRSPRRPGSSTSMAGWSIPMRSRRPGGSRSTWPSLGSMR